MRIVPLIAALGLLSRLAFAEDITVSAGKSQPAIKFLNDGVAYENKGDYANARRCFDEAIRVDPTMWPAYFDRATLDAKEHKFRQGLQDATLALQGKTSFNRSAVLRALINAKMGNYSAAFRELDQVVSLGARGDAYPQALNGLAWLHATSREPGYRNARLAIAQAMQSCSLTSYKKAGLIDTLAAAYAEAGDFDAAVRFEQKAIALGESPDAMEDLQKHLASFRQHRPWRETATN